MPELDQIERALPVENQPPPPATELLPNPTDRQKQILSALGSIDDLSQRLFGHLKAQYLEGNLQRGYSTEPVETRQVIGELAEILVTTEFIHFPIEINGKMLVGQPTRADQETNGRLLGVLHSPSILHLESQTGRNPDLAWVDIHDGTIMAVGDVKTVWKLDFRAFNQLMPNGFEKTTRDTINQLNEQPELGKEVFGINEAGEVIKGQVSSDFFQIVFLPSDTDIGQRNWDNLVRYKGHGPTRDDRGLSSKQARRFNQSLKSGEIKLVTFCFSRQEIHDMIDKLMVKIREMEKAESSQKQYYPESVQLPGDEA